MKIKIARRNFIKRSGLITGGLILSGKLMAGSTSKGNRSPLEFGVCTNLKNAEMLAGGYSYVEEGVRSFLVPDKSEEVFHENLLLNEKSNLQVKACNSFLPGALKCVGENPAHDEILLFSEITFSRAKQAGVKIIVFGSGSARTIPDGFSREKAQDQFIGLCKRIALIAGKYNTMIVIEPLNSEECNFINSVAEGGEIVKKVNHPNFMLLADIYHMLKEEEKPETILSYGHLLKHVHIAEKDGRAAPGTHREDFRPYFSALKKINYTGKMSIECRWKDLQTEAPMALEYIKNQFKSI